MKKFLSVILVIVLIFVCAEPVASTTVIQEQIGVHYNGKATIVMINGFTDQDLNELMAATSHLGKGDTLTLRTFGPGGNALVCMGMMTYIDSLKRKGVYIRTETWSYAASANFFIWLVGDERIVHQDDLLMSHLVIPRDAFGNVLKRSQLSDTQNMMIDHLNKWITKRLYKITKSVKLTQDMLKGTENWYTGLVMFQMGVATGMI